MRRLSTAAVAAATALSLASVPAMAEESLSANPLAGSAQPAQGSSTGHAVAIITGLTAAIGTTALIVFSNPNGVNKIVDILNKNGFNVPHI